MSRETEAVEPTLSEKQHAEFKTWAEEYRTDAEQRDPDYPNGALITAIYDRYQWLETERARLVEENRILEADAAIGESEHDADLAEMQLHAESEIAEVEHASAAEMLRLTEQLTALRAELAQSRTEQQRVETALAEALRQLWRAKDEQRRGEDMLDGLRVVLLDHWPVQVICDHNSKTDQVVCSCARVGLPVCNSVGEAVAAWAEHVIDCLSPWLAMPPTRVARPIARRAHAGGSR